MAATIEKIEQHIDDASRPAPKGITVLRAAATAFMAAGFMCPLIGVLLFVIHSFVTDDHALNRVGSGMIVAAIPFLLIGSHLLDKADEKALRNRDQ